MIIAVQRVQKSSSDAEGGVDLSCGDGAGKTSRKCFAHCWRVLLEPSGLPLAQGVPTNRCCMWQMISHSPFPDMLHKVWKVESQNRSGLGGFHTQKSLREVNSLYTRKATQQDGQRCTPDRSQIFSARWGRMFQSPAAPIDIEHQQHAEGEHQKLVAHQNLTDFPHSQAAHPPDLLHGPEDTRFMPLWSLAGMCVGPRAWLHVSHGGPARYPTT